MNTVVATALLEDKGERLRALEGPLAAFVQAALGLPRKT